MVTATTGSMLFRQRGTGRTFATSIYVSDVAGGLVTFSQVGVSGSGSPTYLQLPAGGVWDLVDIVTLLSPTVAVTMTPLIAGQSINKIIMDATTLSTLPTRSYPPIAINGGSILTMVQN